MATNLTSCAITYIRTVVLQRKRFYRKEMKRKKDRCNYYFVYVYILVLHMPIKHLILKQNILLTSRAINVVCVCYLNFKANNLKGVQVMGKSTFSVKAALTYSNDHNIY